MGEVRASGGGGNRGKSSLIRNGNRMENQFENYTSYHKSLFETESSELMKQNGVRKHNNCFTISYKGSADQKLDISCNTITRCCPEPFLLYDDETYCKSQRISKALRGRGLTSGSSGITSGC